MTTEDREFLTQPSPKTDVKSTRDDRPAGILGLQRAAGNASVAQMLEDERSPVKDLLSSSPGQPLDRETQALMQGRLGHDFSDVRVHADSKATDSARAVNAHAYTVGTNVVFQSDKYSPQTEPGQKMLAHELTHVVQQKAGPVDGTPAPGGIRVSHPSDPFEQAAERNAEQAMSSNAPAQAPVATQASSVQRAGDEDDVQESAVQRAAPAEEEELQASAVQRAAPAEEEELQASAVQRAAPAEEEELQASAVQRAAPAEEEELQASAVQRAAPVEDEDEAAQA
ncbi:MAG TPA: DUF4157 domain-containing protein [Candidatus Dormibacteraeota bacterium]